MRKNYDCSSFLHRSNLKAIILNKISNPRLLFLQMMSSSPAFLVMLLICATSQISALQPQLANAHVRGATIDAHACTRVAVTMHPASSSGFPRRLTSTDSDADSHTSKTPRVPGSPTAPGPVTLQLPLLGGLSIFLETVSDFGPKPTASQELLPPAAQPQLPTTAQPITGMETEEETAAQLPLSSPQFLLGSLGDVPRAKAQGDAQPLMEGGPMQRPLPLPVPLMRSGAADGGKGEGKAQDDGRQLGDVRNGADADSDRDRTRSRNTSDVANSGEQSRSVSFHYNLLVRQDTTQRECVDTMRGYAVRNTCFAPRKWTSDIRALVLPPFHDGQKLCNFYEECS